MRPLAFPPVLAALILTSAFASAQSAATDPVGFLSDNIPANSDATVTAPLNRPSAFQGVIQSIAGNVITVAGTPGWTTSPKQFVRVTGVQPDAFYVQIGNGTKAGMYATVTDNTANSVTITLNPTDDLSGIATEAVSGTGNGAKISIFPYWTPSTLFPANWPAGTQVLLFDDAVAGINPSAAQILVYTGTAWLDNGNGQNANNLLIHPVDAMVIRNQSNNPISRTVLGSVPMIRHRSVVSTLAANSAQDVYIAYQSPAPELIGSSGLGFSAGDQLLVFNNSTTGVNKSASQILIYTGSQWLDNGNGQNVTTTFSLQPGQGYIYRKAPTASPQNFVWQDAQSYNP